MNVSGGFGLRLDSHNWTRCRKAAQRARIVRRASILGMAPTHTDAPETERRFLEPAPSRARADAVLLARYRAGDGSVREEVIQRFLPLARQLARRYARGSEPLDDLFQVA